ncbi:MAG: hypothetical protein HFE90_04145 [Firmicutes bacterium]|nr:hypothetical protein [Bacillota bacterium]
MNISNVSAAVNRASVRSPYLTQLSSGLVVKDDSSGSDLSQTSLIKHIDLSGRQGYMSDYSIQDAADNLWQKEYLTFNIKDLDDPQKASEIVENMRKQAIRDIGNGQGVIETKEEVLNSYIEELRQNGLDGTVDWNSLDSEFKAFNNTTPDELAGGLDYIASRYVAVMDKLERNFSGEELAAQLNKLEQVYNSGKAGMIDGYTEFLKSNMGISENDIKDIKDSFSVILEERVNDYRSALGKVSDEISKTGADSVWLKNHDAYVAFQLRNAEVNEKSEAKYSVQDLSAIGKIAQEYQNEISDAEFGNRNEATLALNISMVDMKAETMINKGLVSKDMASLLRSSRAQAHKNVINALDKRLAELESNRAPGEPKGTFAPADFSVFDGIYNTVMKSFAENGSDAADAVRAGVSYGKTATAQAHANNPKVLRFGNSMEYFWKNFYTEPKSQVSGVMKQHVNSLFINSGGNYDSKSSAYQKYTKEWHDFMVSEWGGTDVHA